MLPFRAFSQAPQTSDQSASQAPLTNASAQAGNVEGSRVGIDAGRPLSFTMFDAIKMALENNREVEVERLNVKQAEFDLFAAKGARDIGLTGNSIFENKTIPIGSILGGGPDGSLTTKTMGYDLSAQQLLKTGGAWQAQFSNARIDTNSQFSSINPQYNTSLSFQIRQPLMRSFKIDDSRRRIQIANRRLDLSDSQFRQKAIDVVSRVQRAYWDIVFALKDLDIRKESVELAKTQLEHNKRLVKDGTLAPIELVSVEVELERRMENVLTSTEAVTRAENSLKQLVLGDRANDIWKRPLLPTDSPGEITVSYSLDNVMAAAFANRVELGQNSLLQEMNNVELKYYENQTKPQFDFIAGYTSMGLSGTLVTTPNLFTTMNALLYERINVLSVPAGLPPLVPSEGTLPGYLIGGYGQSLSNLFKNDFRTIRFGLTFNFPLKNRTAEAQLGRAVAEGKKITASRKMLEQAIESEVRNAVQSVETARQRVETARASREAAQKQLESEQRRFDGGLSTTFFVLERQNALSEARGREVRALTDYNKAVSDLQRVMGITLVSANVDVKASTGDKR